MTNDPRSAVVGRMILLSMILSHLSGECLCRMTRALPLAAE
jgi:hypothetical protein